MTLDKSELQSRLTDAVVRWREHQLNPVNTAHVAYDACDVDRARWFQADEDDGYVTAYPSLPTATRATVVCDPGDESPLQERADEPCKAYDAGKPPLSWLPREPLEAMARVLDSATGNAGKYPRHNWRKGMSWSRHLDSAMRHLTAYCDGEDNDQESMQPHLAHAMVRLAFVLTYQVRGVGHDDRWNAAVMT